MRVISKVRSVFRFSNVVVGAAVALVLTTGTAYAADEWTGDNIVNGSLTGADIKSNSVPGTDLKNDSIEGSKIVNGTITSLDIADGGVTSADVLDETLSALDIAASAVGPSEIATDGVGATEIQNDSIDSGEIVDFSLTNQDIGVLFASINADATVASSSGGVTATDLGVGTYEVDFGVNVSNCAPIVTQGEAAAGGASGAITGATDRSGNAEAFFVTMRTNANALVDRAFHIVVVC